jgi:Protein of unknown function (DUF2384)
MDQQKSNIKRVVKSGGVTHPKKSISAKSNARLAGAILGGEIVNISAGVEIRRNEITKLSAIFLKEDLSKSAEVSLEKTGIFAAAKRVFGNSIKATHWLNYPRFQFNGKSPLEMTATKSGRLAVEELLGQIEHGMFS